MKKYPLKFLDSYTKDDADIFFGRNTEIDTLHEMVFQTDILLIYGASGTGKTSLIQCGLASRFESHDWLDIFVRRGSNINESLHNALAKIDGNLYDDDDDDDFEFDLSNIDGIPSIVSTKGKNSELERQFKNIYLNAFRPIYLIFDQFEELYILGKKEEQAEFIANVKTILNLSQPVKMIFSIREEYLGYLYEFELEIPKLLKKKLRVEPMNITKVQAVIEGVTSYKDSNISIREEEIEPFTEEVFNRLQGKDEKGNKLKSLTVQLPYLQVFLDKVYLEITQDESRTTDAIFSLKELKNIGEIDDVLREFLEEQVISISRELSSTYNGITPENIWQILSPFVTLDGTKEPIEKAVIENKITDIFQTQAEKLKTKENSKQILHQKYGSKSLLKKMRQTFETIANEQNIDLAQDLIGEFTKCKVIRYQDTEDMYEISHDSLAKKIAEKRSDEEIALLEVKRLIKSQTNLKEEARENFTKKQLNFINEYLDKLTLTQEEMAFIRESQLEVEIEEQQLQQEQAIKLQEAIEQAEHDKKLRQRANRFSRIAIGIAGVAALIAVAAIYFFVESKRTEDYAKTQLINSIKSDINVIERDIKTANENIEAFERYNAEQDVIDFEKTKIKDWEEEIKTLDVEIKKLK